MSPQILREHSEQNVTMKQTLKEGVLVDDKFVNDAIVQRLQQLSHSVIILDGYPRNKAQTKMIIKWPTELQQIMALHFDVPDDICITKLLGRRKCSICNGSFNVNGVDANGFCMPPIFPVNGSCLVKCDQEKDWKKRDDDTEETIRKRMTVYHEQTEPVLKYWSEKDKLLTFVPYNGVSDIDAIFNRVDSVLRELSHCDN